MAGDEIFLFGFSRGGEHIQSPKSLVDWADMSPSLYCSVDCWPDRWSWPVDKGWVELPRRGLQGLRESREPALQAQIPQHTIPGQAKRSGPQLQDTASKCA